MSSISPYRRNKEILKTFFARPAILLIAIFYALSAVGGLIPCVAVNLTDADWNVLCAYNLLNSLPSAAFFIFYFGGRGSEAPSYRAPLILLKAYYIINIVCAALFCLCAVFLLVWSYGEYSLPFSELLGISVFLQLLFKMSVRRCAAYILVFAMFFLMFCIGMLRLCGSVGKSSGSIYLSKSGSGFSGATAIILAVLSAAAAVALPYFKLNTDIYLTAINAGNAVVYVLSAVFALSYRRYISKISTSFVGSKADSEKQETEFSESKTEGSAKPADVVLPPKDFVPQPVFVNPTDMRRHGAAAGTPHTAAKPAARIAQADDGQNPYLPEKSGKSANKRNTYAPKPHKVYYTAAPGQMQSNPYCGDRAEQNPYAQPKHKSGKNADCSAMRLNCPICGYECSEGSAFCGNCGFRII